jgi:16S rRNA processing protein RimM
MSNNFIEIAKIGSTYGLDGELRLFPISSSIETILSYGQWYIKLVSDGQWQALNDENVYRRSNKVYIKLDGVDNVNSAQKFINALISVPSDKLPLLNNGEIYWKDLIGMSVSNNDGDSFGCVVNIMETGYNDVLVCRKDKEEYLIPYIKDYVLEENLESKKILVDWQYDY